MERLASRTQILEDRLIQLIEEKRNHWGDASVRCPSMARELSIPVHSHPVEVFRSPHPWKQLLYEAILDGLGYSKNRTPFRCLARNLPLSILEQFDLHNAPTMIALLFGAAGLLPPCAQIGDQESRRYVRALRRTWRDIQPPLHIPLLHEAQWTFFRLRPANFPTARLATLAFLLPQLFGTGSLNRLLDMFAGTTTHPRQRHQQLLDHFRFEPDSFWARHLHFGGPLHEKGIALGYSRTNDILINTLIPFILLYSRLFSRYDAEHNAILLYRTLPPLQLNTVTLEIKNRVLHCKTSLATACLHQGALQLYQQFCRIDRCGECRIGRQIHRGRTGRNQSRLF
jgi:hypothetical protein